MQDENEKLTLSIPQAALRLGISAPTLRISIRKGTFPALRLGNNKIRIPVAALERYLSSAGSDTGTKA
jgi:excisionase family DNA binding protein